MKPRQMDGLTSIQSQEKVDLYGVRLRVVYNRASLIYHFTTGDEECDRFFPEIMTAANPYVSGERSLELHPENNDSHQTMSNSF